MKPGKRNIEGKKHLGLRKKETMDLLTKKPRDNVRRDQSQGKKGMPGAIYTVSSKKTI